MVHIVVAILGKATTEDGGTLLCQGTIFIGKMAVFLVIYRVIWLCTRLPLGWVLASDDGMLCRAATIEVAVLDNAGIRGLAVGEVHNRNTLIVRNIQLFMFKAQGAILEFAIAVVEVAVNLARIDNFIGNALPMLAIIEEVALKLDIRPDKQTSDKLVIPPRAEYLGRCR